MGIYETLKNGYVWDRIRKGFYNYGREMKNIILIFFIKEEYYSKIMI